MEENNYRIPPMAMAVLVLGGACGDDDKETLDDRIERVAGLTCEDYAQCDASEFASYWDSQADCRADFLDGWKSYVETYGKNCMDLVLDVYECYAKSGSCSDDEEPCVKERQKAFDDCPEFFEDVAEQAGDQGSNG